MNPADRWLELALEAARLGGDLLLKNIGRIERGDIESKRHGDWVSSADRASEAAIVEMLTEEAPDHAILTEEAGFIRREKPSQFRWIIDPLDGTTNYLRRFPCWAVSVALEWRTDPGAKWGDIVVGAVCIPPTGETFWAARGEGAWRDGVRMSVGEGRPFRDSLLATGFPFRTRHLVGPYMALLQDLLGRCADVRRAGAVAVDLCYTAAGVFDGFWELDLAPWDIAAGALIIQEAGGCVGDFQGNDGYLATGDIIAGNPKLYNELVGIVKAHFPQPRAVDKSPG